VHSNTSRSRASRRRSRRRRRSQAAALASCRGQSTRTALRRCRRRPTRDGPSLLPRQCIRAARALSEAWRCCGLPVGADSKASERATRCARHRDRTTAHEARRRPSTPPTHACTHAHRLDRRNDFAQHRAHRQPKHVLAAEHRAHLPEQMAYVHGRGGRDACVGVAENIQQRPGTHSIRVRPSNGEERGP
jgi:hypothetical protein